MGLFIYIHTRKHTYTYTNTRRWGVVFQSFGQRAWWLGIWGLFFGMLIGLTLGLVKQDSVNPRVLLSWYTLDMAFNIYFQAQGDFFELYDSIWGSISRTVCMCVCVCVCACTCMCVCVCLCLCWVVGMGVT